MSFDPRPIQDSQSREFQFFPRFLAVFVYQPNLNALPARVRNSAIGYFMRKDATMARSDELTSLFLHPITHPHRDFEICRDYFLQGKTAQQISTRFELHVGTVQSIVRDFAKNPELDQFFTLPPPRTRATPKRDAVRARVMELRQQGLSLG